MTEREIHLFARDMANLIGSDFRSVRVKLWFKNSGKPAPDIEIR